MAPPRKPESYVTFNCPVCGKEVTTHKSRPLKTCSMECREKLLHPDAKTTSECPECGKTFEHYKSSLRKYCSKSCAAQNTKSNIKRWKPSAFEATCEQCGNRFTATPSGYRGRFCSRKCYGDWFRENAPRGEDHPRHGIKTGRPDHLPPPLTKTCVICGNDFVTKSSHFQRRQTCSRKCLGIWLGQTRAGENSPTWKGGYEPYYGPNWRPQRRAARRRDNYTCQRCGISEDQLGRQLDVHHIKPFREFDGDFQAANKLQNLISLCFTCHTTVEHHGLST